MEGDTKDGAAGGDAKGNVAAEAADQPAQGGGWGGWGFSPFSYISDLQKAAAVAAEEISRNAAAVAKTFTDMDNTPEDSEPSKEEEEATESVREEEVDNEKDTLRKSALDRLEQASEDSLLSQGLKVIDFSMENFASGAWQALGSTLKGGSNFMQKIEDSAVNLADSIERGGAVDSVTPSLLETGKAFTAKGIKVLENVGKEAMDLLISETGFDIEKKSDEANQADEDQLEEMTFDRCFYIYGGPEQLEELEAFSSHYALVFNRRKAKLSSDDKSFYEGKLKQVQKVLDLKSDAGAGGLGSDKGKKIENHREEIDNELRSLHDASISKSADMAAGFTNVLGGLAASDIIQRTAGRLESLHSEGVHGLSELCCFATSQLLSIGKSIIANANKTEENTNIEWPDDCIEKANIIRTKAQSMAGSVESVSNSYITGISEVAEACLAALNGAAEDSEKSPLAKSIQEKAGSLSECLRSDQASAISKIEEGVQYLSFVIASASLPSA